jgi:hypothetical protein
MEKIASRTGLTPSDSFYTLFSGKEEWSRVSEQSAQIHQGNRAKNCVKW